MSESPAVQRVARKPQQRSLQTQQKLLDAAIEAFAENGFKGTSTRDIAERAGVHHPLITYHFKSKDQLWRAGADRIWSEFNDALSRALARSEASRPRAQMATLIRAYVMYAQSQPALHKMMLNEASYPNPRLDWLVDTHLKPFFEDTVSRLSDLQEQGLAPAGDPALLFNLIRAAAGSLLASNLEIRRTSGVDFESRETVEALAEMMVRIFLPGEED
ncbi:MAG: TetR/AcrR family transcriptional regulator [Pseudomonadota bacterium]